MFPFAYHATICSEFTEWKNEERHGVTLAPSFKDAMDNIEDYYGEELVNVFVGAINAQKTDHVVTVVMLGMVIPMYVCILSTSRKANNNGISFIYIFYILSVLFYFGQYVLIMIGCFSKFECKDKAIVNNVYHRNGYFCKKLYFFRLFAS